MFSPSAAEDNDHASIVSMLRPIAFASLLPKMSDIVRPVYAKKSILPGGVAAGIESGAGWSPMSQGKTAFAKVQ